MVWLTPVVIEPHRHLFHRQSVKSLMNPTYTFHFYGYNLRLCTDIPIEFAFLFLTLLIFEDFQQKNKM